MNLAHNGTVYYFFHLNKPLLIHKDLKINITIPIRTQTIAEVNDQTEKGSDEEEHKLSNLKLINRLQDFRRDEFFSCIDTTHTDHYL